MDNMADLYNVVIQGRIIPGSDEQEVKHNLVKIFKAPPDKVESLFSGKMVTVKKAIDHDHALKISAMIKKAGAECKIIKQRIKTSSPLVMEKEIENTQVPEKVYDDIPKPDKTHGTNLHQTNPYKSPKANLSKTRGNNSGQGKDIVLPDGVKGWSWGAFLLNWIWAIGNRTWIGLFALTPYLGFIFAVLLGIKGRQWAWQNKRWESVEHFQQVQKKWSYWAVIILVLLPLIGIIAAIAIPMFLRYR